METTTIEREAEKRAKKAGVPVDVILPAVREQFEKRPFQVEYGELNNFNLADVTFIELGPDQDPVIRVTFNTRHTWVLNMMLGSRVTPETRAGIEVTLCTVFGARHGLTDDEKREYTIMMNVVSQRLEDASRIMLEPGKDGLNMLGEDPFADQWDEPDGD